MAVSDYRDLITKDSIIFICMLLSLLIAEHIMQLFQKSWKPVIEKVLNFIGSFRSLNSTNGSITDIFLNLTDKYEYKNVSLFSRLKFDWTDVRNSFTGKYKSLDTKIEEIGLYYYPPKGPPIFVFSGIVIKIFNFAEYKGNTIIQRCGSFKPKFFEDMNKMSIKNTEFNKYYDIYSNNFEAVQTILTQAFMQKMMQLNKKTRLKKTAAVFENDGIYIAAKLYSRFFNIPIFKSSCSPSAYKKFVLELMLLFEILDIL